MSTKLRRFRLWPNGFESPLSPAAGVSPGPSGSTPDGRIEIVIRGHNEYALAGELAWLTEWLEVTSPQGVRDHLASIGGALVARYS
jgi:hypothetical protein